jgi:hypothetical protein
VPDADETETRVEFDGLAEALVDLGRLKLRKGFRNVFDILDEDRSAIDESNR